MCSPPRPCAPEPARPPARTHARTGLQRHGHHLLLRRVALQRRVGRGPGLAVRPQRLRVRARAVPHAAVLQRRLVQRDPNAHSALVGQLDPVGLRRVKCQGLELFLAKKKQRSPQRCVEVDGRGPLTPRGLSKLPLVTWSWCAGVGTRVCGALAISISTVRSTGGGGSTTRCP
jgi:hypothetical protein